MSCARALQFLIDLQVVVPKLSDAHMRPSRCARSQKSPCPAPTDTWTPIPHAEVVDVLTKRAHDRGLVVRDSRFTVVDGALYPSEGVKVEIKGARLFGKLDLEPIAGVDFPDGCIPSLGVRNSTDKSYALSILAGARVLVCSNGVLAGEYVVSRRHTSGIDLGDSIDRALDMFMESVKGFGELHERLRGRKVSVNKAKALTVDLADAGAIPSAHILPVVREFEKPSFREFRGDRSAWGLYGAVTHSSFKRMIFRGHKPILYAMVMPPEYPGPAGTTWPA